MIGQLFIPLAAAFGLLAGGPGPSVPAVVAQAGSGSESRAETDAALQSVRAIESALDAKRVARGQLERVHKRQLTDIERLRRRRASWNRDRKLRAKRADAHATGVELARVEADIRQLRGQLQRRRRVLLRAIDEELAEGPSVTRRVALVKTRRQIAAVLRPKPKKIRLPDVQIDRLADPEELMEQAALIRRAERKLLREERKLEERAERYQRIARLEQKRRRDVELGDLDAHDVRRVTGRVSDPGAGKRGGGGAESGLDSSGGGAPAPDDADNGPGGFESEPGDGSDFVSTSVVLSEVVEPGTIDALRRAGRTGDAESRAEAAARARRDVASKLRKLRERREQIERRARELKKR